MHKNAPPFAELSESHNSIHANTGGLATPRNSRARAMPASTTNRTDVLALPRRTLSARLTQTVTMTRVSLLDTCRWLHRCSLIIEKPPHGLPSNLSTAAALLQRRHVRRSMDRELRMKDREYTHLMAFNHLQAGFCFPDLGGAFPLGRTFCLLSYYYPGVYCEYKHNALLFVCEDIYILSVR